MTTADLFAQLGRRLDEQTPALSTLDAYYCGRQPLSFLSDKAREALGTGFRTLSVNFPRLAVTAVAERLRVDGFRLGGVEAADADMWRIWRRNRMADGSAQAHLDALALGRSFVIVWAGADRATPRITVESARQVTAITDPATRQVTAALKRWEEPADLSGVPGPSRGVVYEPDRITVYSCAAPGVPADSGAWKTVRVLPNPLGVAPVIPVVNRGRILDLDGRSEMADLLDLADALNKLGADLMTGSEYFARPRRWATGVEIVEDDDGNPVDVFDEARRVWQAEPADAKFGQMQGADLSAYSNAIAVVTQQIGALSSLPPHYLGLHGDQPASADALRSSEATLVARAIDKQRAFGQAWADVASLVIAARDGIDPATVDADVVWASAETRTPAQAADAASKLVAAGIIPADQALDDLGYTPTQVEHIRELRRQSTLDAAAGNLAGMFSTPAAP